ncbi:MAG: divergent polysaccharide deacetylase family protein [Rickettsiales bacterium]
MNSLPAYFWKKLFWKTILIILVCIFLGQLTFIWVLGKEETKDAFDSGRRILINIENDQLSGKIISSVEDIDDKGDKISETANNNPQDNKETTKIKEEDDNKAEDTVSSHSEIIDDGSEAHSEELVKIETSYNKDEDLPPLEKSKNQPLKINEELFTETEFGKIPKISSDGKKPWQYYAKNMKIDSSKPMIAIIVSGLGQYKYSLDHALRLPENINLSFSPYSPNIDVLLSMARTSGHEVMLDLPMESIDYPASDPGPLGLLVSKDQQENEIKIKKIMAKNSSYVGFVTPKNEIFLENIDLAKSLIKILSMRGLMMIVGKKPAKQSIEELIEVDSTSNAIIDTVIDEELSESSINAKLLLLEQMAAKKGYAIGLIDSYPISIKYLEKWINRTKNHDFNLVPVSAIISKRN